MPPANTDLVRHAIEGAFEAKVADLFKLILLDVATKLSPSDIARFNTAFRAAVDLRDAALKEFCP